MLRNQYQVKNRFWGLICFWLVAGLSQIPSAYAERSFDILLEQLNAEDSADANRYSLTNVQFVLDARLSWNSLLQRASLIEDQGGLSFTLVVGSRVGRCGNKMVDWPDAPSIRNGQVFVSEGLLRTVFDNFPDYRLRGEVAPEPPAIPIEETGQAELSPEEPPEPPTQSTRRNVRNLLVLLVPASGSSGSATGSDKDDLVLEEIKKIFQDKQIRIRSAVWNTEKPEDSYLDGDVMVALRISSASPVALCSFFYYNAGSSQTDSRKSILVEWNQVNPGLQTESRNLAEIMFRRYIEKFGEDRSSGVRSGPIQYLQGRQMPAVYVSTGVNRSEQSSELRKLAEVIFDSVMEFQGS